MQMLLEERAGRLEERRQDRLDREADRRAAPRFHNEGTNPSSYRIGASLKETPSFDGTGDSAAFLDEITVLLNTFEIPEQMWPRELRLKLTGAAKSWYRSHFHDLPQNTFPPWPALCSALLLTYSPLYQAAAAYQALHGASRVPGSTGREALDRLDALLLDLARWSVRATAGPNESYAYILQNQLTRAELPCWTAQANGDTAISDAGLAALDLPAAAGTTRHSCSFATREAFFAARVTSLQTFLREQPAAPGKATARAAVAEAEAPVMATPSSPPARDNNHPDDTTTVRLCAVLERWNRRAAVTVTPGTAPEYHGTGQQHHQANLATFNARKANKECFACREDQLVKGEPHWKCKFHGLHGTARNQRVRGAGGGN